MKIASLIVAVIGMTSLAACEGPTSGTGSASSPMGNIQATLNWTATGDRSGTMTATVNNGETFTGPFFQLTRETRGEELAPLWVGWGGRHWGGGWNYWGPDSVDTFTTEYTGRVVANLSNAKGQHMRCRLHLIHPNAGMAGGGEGRCQLPMGENIDAMFPPAST